MKWISKITQIISCSILILSGYATASENTETKTPLPKHYINVCAVTQLYDVLENLKQSKDFQSSRINVTYGSATTLYSKIANRELNCDIYLGNDTKYPVKYIESDLADAKTLTIINKTPLALWSITDIVDKDCKILEYGTFAKIVLPSPKVTVSGFAAMQALHALELDTPQLTQKFLTTQNEYLALSFVQNGNAMLGFAPYSLLVHNESIKYGSYCLLPAGSYDPLYVYAIIFKTKNVTQSSKLRSWLTFLLSEKAKAVFKEHGFY